MERPGEQFSHSLLAGTLREFVIFGGDRNDVLFGRSVDVLPLAAAPLKSAAAGQFRVTLRVLARSRDLAYRVRRRQPVRMQRR